MHGGPGLLTGFQHHFMQFVADGIGQADVADHAVAKKGRLAVKGAVDELIGDHDVTGDDLFLHTADGADGDDAFHPQLLHGEDVGAVVDVRRRDAVPDTVTRQKRHAGALQFAHDDFVRRIAKGSLHGDSCPRL